MMEKIKTTVLAILVAASLVQSYFLAYSFPGLGAKVATGQSYTRIEQMGKVQKVENTIFPEQIVLHFGSDQHTVLVPGQSYYNSLFNGIKLREFGGLQRRSAFQADWDEVERGHKGVELRFGTGIPVPLLQKVMRLTGGDLLFLQDTIDRVWIYLEEEPGFVRVYLGSSDGRTVYESTRADLTVSDLEQYLGPGVAWVPYRKWGGRLYLPETPVQAVDYEYAYEKYTPEQMQRSLFFDPGTTKAIQDGSDTKVYTNGKSVLQLQQNGSWMSYTDPVADLNSENRLSDNVLAAVQYVNDHGGWDGLHRFVGEGPVGEGDTIEFQKYHHQYPVIGSSGFSFGSMRLVLKQGVVSEYERSMLTVGDSLGKTSMRWLPGGNELLVALSNYERKAAVESLYPALRVTPVKGKQAMRMEPVWAVRLIDGSQEVLMTALPATRQFEDFKLPKLRLPLPEEPSGQNADGTQQDDVLVDPRLEPKALNP